MNGAALTFNIPKTRNITHVLYASFELPFSELVREACLSLVTNKLTSAQSSPVFETLLLKVAGWVMDAEWGSTVKG